MNTPTIQAPEAKADLSTADPYALLGTHAMRYAAEDVARIKESLTAARASLPVISRAFRANDARALSDAVADADLDLIRALAKADSLLASLRAQ